MLQDYPQLTNVHMSPDMIRRMAAGDPRLVMLKAEDWPGLDKLTALRRLSDEGKMRRLSILGGNGGLFLPEELERGADGIMTGYAVPEMLVRVQRFIEEGDRTAAHDLFDLHLPLIRKEHAPVHAAEHQRDEASRLFGVELGRFAHDAQQRQAGSAGGQEEVRHALGAGLVQRAVLAEGGGRDDEDTLRGLVQTRHQAALLDMSSGGCTSGGSGLS